MVSRATTSLSQIRERVAARHAEVLGQPPRIAPLDREVVAEQVQAATAQLRSSVTGDAPLPLDAIPEIMFTRARFPDLWQKINSASFGRTLPEKAGAGGDPACCADALSIAVMTNAPAPSALTAERRETSVIAAPPITR